MIRLSCKQNKSITFFDIQRNKSLLGIPLLALSLASMGVCMNKIKSPVHLELQINVLHSCLYKEFQGWSHEHTGSLLAGLA